jgi:Na+-transporting methylmalonyl-CoA/oxaloacetate decarboxylase gamma subunit
MGGVILIFLLVLLVVILATPALRTRLGRDVRPEKTPDKDPPHEVVVHQLDDHRKK